MSFVLKELAVGDHIYTDVGGVISVHKITKVFAKKVVTDTDLHFSLATGKQMYTTKPIVAKYANSRMVEKHRNPKPVNGPPSPTYIKKPSFMITPQSKRLFIYECVGSLQGDDLELIYGIFDRLINKGN